jgi:hypothetical protein
MIVLTITFYLDGITRFDTLADEVILLYYDNIIRYMMVYNYYYLIKNNK